MPFLETRNDQLAPLDLSQVSAGPTAGFGDNFWQMYEQQYRVDSMFGLEAELLDRYNDNISHVEGLIGEDLGADTAAGYDYFATIARRASGKDPHSGVTMSRQQTEQILQDFDQREARLRQLKEQYPDVKTFDEIFEEVKELRRRTVEETQRVSDTSGVVGLLGGLAGGIAGSFSWRDPLLLGSLPFGGFGRTAAMRILTEAGVGAGVEAAQQFGAVQPTQEMLGEEGTNPWASIALAGIGAGVFRGGIEGTAAGFRAGEQRLFPDRARARVIRDTIEESARVPIEQLMAAVRPQRMSDDALLAAVRSLPPSPAARAAGQALDADMTQRAQNPYGTSREAQLRLEREMEITARTFEGRDLPPHLRPDTAVGRFIEQRTAEIDSDPIRVMGRQTAPEVYARLDAADAAVRAAELRIEELAQVIDNRTMADAVGLLDEASGARVRQIEAELDQPIPAPRRQELEAELDLIVDTLGNDAIARAEREFRIGPERQLRDARKGRTQAKKVFNKAQKEAATVEARVRKQAAEEDLVRTLISPEPEMRALSRTTAQQLEEFAPRIPEVVEGIVQRNADMAVSPREEAISQPSAIGVEKSVPAPRDLTEFEVYHGTVADFERFDPTFLGNETDVASAREGFFFTSDVRVAAGYAEDFNPYEAGVFARIRLPKWYQRLNEKLLTLLRGKGVIEKGKILRTKVRLENPLIVDRGGKEVVDSEQTAIIHEAKANGHDGVIFRNSRDVGFTDESDIPSDVFVVFDHNKIDVISKHKTAEEATRARGREAESPPQGVDFGEELDIPEDFMIALDPEGTQMVSARALMDDLGEDTRLMEAMRSCAI